MKKALVLEGGAMRGLFSAGAMDAMMEEGILFDGAVGVSAGAAFGCNLKSGQKGRVLRYNTRFCASPEYHSLSSLLKTGDLYGADFCYRRLPEELDPFDWEAYEKNPMEFFAVCTDLETGKAAYFSCDGERERIMDIFRASASMPLVSRNVSVDGRLYLDGGVATSIPLAFMEERGYERIVVILTQPRDFVKKKNRAAALVRLKYGKYPAFCEAMARRHETYNAETRSVFQGEAEGRVFVLAPESSLGVSRTEKDAKKLFEAHKMGYEAAKARLSELKAFLSE